jgi:hypothetical protein
MAGTFHFRGVGNQVNFGSNTGGAYSIGKIPGVWNNPSLYNGNTISDVLGILSSHPNDTAAIYTWLTGYGASGNMADELDAIRKAWDAAGGAKGALIDLYPTQGGYDPVTKSRRSPTGGGGGGGGYIDGGGQSSMTASMENSAYSIVTDALDQWGLMSLAPLAQQLITDPGNHLNANEVMQKIRATPQYQARFPGMAEIIAKGGHMTEATYMQYENDIQNQAAYYGLPHGFISNPQELGKLIANGIYGQNLTDRIQKGYEAAKTAPAETRRLLHEYYGVNTGHLAAYFLDPKKTAEILTKQMQGAQIGTAAYKSGWGDPGKRVANQLAAQAQDSGLSMDYFRTGFAKAEQLAPLEHGQVGLRGEATATKGQILSQEFTGLNQPKGTTPAENAAAIQLAQQARTAGLSGGGGFITNAKGGLGVGRTSTAGTQGT